MEANKDNALKLPIDLTKVKRNECQSVGVTLADDEMVSCSNMI